MPKPPSPKRIYSPTCSVCQFMRRHPDFRAQIIESKHFNTDGVETVRDVCKRWDLPFTETTVYRHLAKHQPKDLTTIPESDVKVVESKDAHISGLDDFIAQGREKLARGELHISADSFLKAVKTKADIESKNKDRSLDALKLMAGAFGGQIEAPEPSDNK